MTDTVHSEKQATAGFVAYDDGRIARLKAAALAQRCRHFRLLSTYYLDAYLANLDKPPLLREALAMQHRCAHEAVEIAPDEVIVGRSTYEAFDFNFLGGICLDRDAESAAASAGDEALAAKLALAREYVTRERMVEAMSAEERQAVQAGLAGTSLCSGHHLLDLDWLLGVGLAGIEEEIDVRQRWGGGLDPDFYAAMKATVAAVSTLIARYGERAAALAATEPDAARQAELGGIADTCAWISRRPPRTFHEALQLVWSVHALNGLDSFGRFDQYLWPFYERDLSRGTITREQAGYLLQLTWLKILEGTYIQNLTLGGLDADGREVSNDLTFLCLETTRALATPQPNLSLRLSPDSPPRLLDAALETIGLGLGVPALYNDEVFIAGLEGLGVPLRDARGYALAGCSQVMIPGRSHFLCDDGVFNAAKCLELALNDGVDALSGRQLGPRTGSPDSFADLGAVIAAFKEQVRYAADMLGRSCNTTDRIYAESCGFPLRTLLVRSCLERGKGIWDGGAAYNGIQAECVGITDTADSLAAIGRLVFSGAHGGSDDGACSLPDLVQALRDDWSGQERLRALCRGRAPKFGNDDDYVDAIYRDVAETVYREVRRQTARRGGAFIPGSVVFTYNVGYGRRTGATADGRRARSPLADSAGASHGCNRSGATALLNSMAKFDQSLGTTCVVLNLMFTRADFRSGMVGPLLRSYFERGGMQVQVNVVDGETLKRAQERPAEYRHLTVRVGGYSAYFTELDRAQQDEILARTPC
ncbi:MAG: pyruvate formate lyase family protein [Anaerolineae bacterium]